MPLGRPPIVRADRGVVERRRVEREPERGHEHRVPLQEHLLRVDGLHPPRRRAHRREDILPRRERRLSDVAPLLDEQVLEEQAEEWDADPPARE